MADSIMKLGLVLSATDKMSRVIDQAVKKSTSRISDFQKRTAQIGAALTAAGGSITGVLFADVNSIASAAKQIDLSSQKIGMSAETFQVASAFAKKYNVEVSGLEMAMGKFQKAQVSAAMGNKSAAKIFKMAGISIYDVNGNLKNSTNILADLSDSFKNAPNGPKKTALAMMLFGRSGREMIPMLNQGSAAMEAYGQKMEQNGMIIHSDQLPAFAKYRAATAQMKMATIGMKTQIAVAVLPVVLKYTQKIADITQKIMSWVQKNKELAQKILVVAAVLGVVLTVLGTFVVTAGTVMMSISMLSKSFIALKAIMIAAKSSMILFKIQYYALAAAQNIATIAQKAFTAAQWLLNAAMDANPIGAVILVIGLLVSGVMACINAYDRWGAVMMFIVAGPFAMLITAVMSIRRNWDSIVKAFKDGGIIAGIKRIGTVLLDVILYPIQQLLQLLSKIPGVGDLAGSGAEQIAKLRKGLNLADPESSTESAPASVAAIDTTQRQIVNTTQTAQSVANNNSKSAQTVNYSPTINVKGGSSEDKIAFKKILDDHKSEIEKFLDNMNHNKARLSYS